jgi:hypothetical protein
MSPVAANDNADVCGRCGVAHQAGFEARRTWCVGLLASEGGTWQAQACSPQLAVPGSPVVIVGRPHAERAAALIDICELVDAFDVARAAARLDRLLAGLAQQQEADHDEEGIERRAPGVTAVASAAQAQSQTSGSVLPPVRAERSQPPKMPAGSKARVGGRS